MKWLLSGVVCVACYGAGLYFYGIVPSFWQPLIMFWAGIADMLIYAAISEGMRR